MISRVGSLYEAIPQEVKIMLLKIISFLCAGFGFAFLYARRVIPENTGNFVPGFLFILIGIFLYVIPRISADKKAAEEQKEERKEAHTKKPMPQFSMNPYLNQPQKPATPQRSQAQPKPQAPKHPRAQTAAASDYEEKTISFRVAGVTFDNDDGTSRQDILRHLHFGDAPYADDPEDLDVEFIETDYQGDPAIEVHINGYQVGHVPKGKVNAMLKAIASHADTVDSVRIIGGGRKEDGERMSYGCEIEVSYI